MVHDSSIADVRSAQGVARLARFLFGGEPLSSGILHPAAVWQDGGGRLVTIRIGPSSPRSALDSFSLNLARARADAIVTTGKNLRSEPDLLHDLQGPGHLPGALEAWRRERLGKHGPPISLILTTGKELDFTHRLFQGGTKVLVFTTNEAAKGLKAEAEAAGAEIVGEAEPSIRSALRFLRRRGAQTVAVEAGPSTSGELYRAPVVVDEALLSVYGAPDLAAELQGGELPGWQQLSAQFKGASGCAPAQEKLWTFYRFFR